MCYPYGEKCAENLFLGENELRIYFYGGNALKIYFWEEMHLEFILHMN